MRELIRLLSSCLPVGKIPGIWEFIWPLLYNCLSPSLYCFHTLCQKIQTQSPISLYTHLALFVLRTATCLLFSFAALSASHTGTRPPLPLLYYIPLRLIKLIPSFTCNHVIHTFFRSFVLQPRHLLLCLFALIVCFLNLPSDCLSPLIAWLWHLFLLCSPLTYTQLIIWQEILSTCAHHVTGLVQVKVVCNWVDFDGNSHCTIMDNQGGVRNLVTINCTCEI